ncbi:hypothetical protein [Sporolactobacillus terrae]|uniref:Uncharacterized protein n=1 Tax=Sporolactobacillus terrae TaxID=269673 RepID=A0ABX5Q932_9BACL|nr:hypothetical protein [Sporolactobacillus terrae]QAA23181.1 hypothetical protein C0674_11410 [Sporolactobacillus terrae]QAA26151.1 hypothetical protein C0679_11390 [Sporolactobacillus terrae]UAK15246.1 hypothetical protein K7399_09060 [Sporolactobacillus terrae]
MIISAIGLIVYALFCLISGIVIWSKTDQKVVVVYFLCMHLVCLIMGMLMISTHLPLLLVLIILSATLVSRIANGCFIFHRINLLHHVFTGAYFIALLLLNV